MSELDGSPRTLPNAGPWRLMRQDDNGNRYVVAEFAVRDAARNAQAEFEARGHKQLFWIENESGADGP